MTARTVPDTRDAHAAPTGRSPLLPRALWAARRLRGTGGRGDRGRRLVAACQRRTPGCGQARRRRAAGAAPRLAAGRWGDGRLRHLRSRPRPRRRHQPDPLRPVGPGRGLGLRVRDGRHQPDVRVVHPRGRARDRAVRPDEPGHRVDLRVGRGGQPRLPDLGWRSPARSGSGSRSCAPSERRPAGSQWGWWPSGSPRSQATRRASAGTRWP